MTYIVLARKWRPLLFEDVIGQEHITRILINALQNQRIAHAYIFSGPRGVGKTTTARLLAKAVNCENQPVVNPCNKCSTCKSITNGQCLDVIEIDGASNRGIDEIRNLRDNIRFTPASSQYKIYIIDEVHMLTKEAFNALLKTLEEPPSHAIFIFATTEIHRVPLTILSRCQRFDFKRIPTTQIQEMLNRIVDSEKIKIEQEALLLISRKADGSMRDAESILDQMISFGGNKLTTEQVRNSLGLIDQETFFEFTELLLQKSTPEILKFANKIFASGHDLIDFIHGLQEHFRNILISGALQDTKLLDVADHLKKRYEQISGQYPDKDLIHYLHILGESEQSIKFSTFPELTLEMLLLKLAFKPPSVNLEEILLYLESKSKVQLHENDKKNRAIETPDQVELSHVSNSVRALPQSKNREWKSRKDKPISSSSETVHSGFANLEGTLKNYQELKEPSSFSSKADLTPSVNIGLEDIKLQWPNILDKVRSQKIALGAFLQEGIPYQLEKGQLVIAYDQSTAFHQEHVAKNSKLIEQILKNDFHLPFTISFKLIDFKSEGIEKQPRTPEEIVNDIKNKEPVIRKIIDVFNLDESINKDS